MPVLIRQVLGSIMQFLDPNPSRARLVIKVPFVPLIMLSVLAVHSLPAIAGPT